MKNSSVFGTPWRCLRVIIHPSTMSFIKLNSQWTMNIGIKMMAVIYQKGYGLFEKQRVSLVK